jgi:valyl-tRNA synthetase
MSKTKGNVVDPITLIDEFGADALRFTLALAAGQSRDMRIGPTRVETNRNFATKLWNATRFCEMNGCFTVPSFDPASVTQTVNKWIVEETHTAVEGVKAYLIDLRFNDAAGAAYHFVWDVFCDWYLEFAKPLFNGLEEEAKAETRATAAWARDQILKLLHPFMPFVTEELWEKTAVTPRESLLVVAPWPEFSLPDYSAATREMDWVKDLIKGVRSVRAEMNVPAAAKIPLLLNGILPEQFGWFENNRELISTMARLSSAEVGETPPRSVQFAILGASVALPLNDIIDFAKEQARLEKELKKATDEIARLDAKLANERFIQNASEEAVGEERKKRTEASGLVIRLEAALSILRQ